jgi:hypothetical protein
VHVGDRMTRYVSIQAGRNHGERRAKVASVSSLVVVTSASWLLAEVFLHSFGNVYLVANVPKILTS